MGLLDSIFGSSPSTQTSSTPTMSPQQQAAYNSLLASLSAGPTTSSAAYTPYSGQMTAPLSNLQNMSLSAIEQQTMNEAVGGPGSTKAASQAMDQLIKSGGSPVDINNVFESSVEQPMLQDFQTKILPMLQSTFSGANAFGSDKLAQQGILTNNLTNNLTSARATMSYASQTDAANRLMQAAGLLPQISAASNSILQGGLAAGAVPQATDQAALTAQYNEFLRGQTASQGNVNQLMQLLGMQTQQNTTTVTPGTSGLLSGVLNTLTAGMLNPNNSLGSAGGLGGGTGAWGSVLGDTGISTALATAGSSVDWGTMIEGAMLTM